MTGLVRPKVWFYVYDWTRPTEGLVRFMEETVSALQTEIEARLAGVEPEVEVLLAEIAGPTLRLFIDHPDGVTLAVCERVTGHLSDYRERFSLEVSSPGQDRPLTKPQHYSRFLGRRARVRLREAAGGPHSADRRARRRLGQRHHDRGRRRDPHDPL